ncbi:MAG: hypothetical protein JWL84_1351 [Rhodospirillales bacterium]|nr:hypothetical protein [Rhodospirillales bacterium]
MSEPENFVSRWSRLKRDAKTERKVEPAGSSLSSDARQTCLDEAAVASPATATPPSQIFDPASLPPIDAITVGTDIRAFLRSGVPAELTRAALRRAWVSDPAIRDFIGIAENQWDFTDPTAIPGFGALRETDDVPSLVAQALGQLGKSTAAFVAMPVPLEEAPSETPADPVRSAPSHGKGSADAAAEHESAAAENGNRRHRRPHGGALPQ